MTDNLERITREFAREFSKHEIELPPDKVANRERGLIQGKRVFIQFLFGRDEVGEYLDYYAANRWGDDHVRLRDNGRRESLPTFSTMLHYDPSEPGAEQKAKEESARENREAERLLIEKGFDKFTINMGIAADLGHDMDEED